MCNLQKAIRATRQAKSNLDAAETCEEMSDGNPASSEEARGFYISEARRLLIEATEALSEPREVS